MFDHTYHQLPVISPPGLNCNIFFLETKKMTEGDPHMGNDSGQGHNCKFVFQTKVNINSLNRNTSQIDNCNNNNSIQCWSLLMLNCCSHQSQLSDSVASDIDPSRTKKTTDESSHTPPRTESLESHAGRYLRTTPSYTP